MRTTAVSAVFLAIALFAAPLAHAKDKDKDRFQHPGPVKLDHDGEKWAEKTLKGMSLEEKVGQMFMIWARAEFLNVNSPEYLQLRDTMRKYHIGGFGLTVHLDGNLLLKSEPFEAAALVNQLQRDSQLPLIFAADFERGVAMRLNGSTVFPHAMAFGATGDPKLVQDFGRITGEEARAVGVEWNWFPDADVNSNPANPIINTRSFGEDPKEVGDMVSAYIKGAHEAGMLTTLKHFPGHGDTATDSHLSLAMVSGDRQRLAAVELPPFKKGIEAGADAVMVAHVTVPALDPAPDHVATTSPIIIQDLLKRQLGFKGLVVTDALDMNALMRLYSTGGASPSALAAVATIKAGNDMVIIPADLDAAYNGVLKAVRSGEIYEKQIDESVLKILKAKASVGLNKARLVDLDALQRRVADPKSVAEAQETADRAVTLVKDSGSVLPFTPDVANNGTNQGGSPYARVVRTTNRVVALIFTDSLRSEDGRMFAQQLRARVPDASVIWIDPNNADFSSAAVLATVDNAEKVIAAVYAVPSAGRTLAVRGGQTALLTVVMDRAANKTVLVAMGNPYVASDYPQASTLLCTFSNAQVSEISAVKALFGEIPVRGRLPVTIPQIAQRGAGIDRSQVAGGANGETKGVAAK
jgi:beta-N-acetylhexosaminidase